MRFRNPFSGSFRRAFPRAAPVAAAAVLAVASLFSPFVPRALSAASAKADGALAGRLSAVERMRACIRLSDPRPVNAATGIAPELRGAERSGDGSWRRFDGLGDELFRIPGVRWNEFAEKGGTVFLRFRVDDATRESRFVWERKGLDSFGLRLVDGRMEAFFADSSGTHSVCAGFPGTGRFVSVAFVLSPESASLWIDGKKAAEAPVAPGGLVMGMHPVEFGPVPNARPVCDLAAFAVWTRPLSDSEAASVPRDPGRPFLHCPFFAAAASAAGGALRAWRCAARLADDLVPRFSALSVGDDGIPTLTLRLSGKDRRHFMLAHGESLSSGFRTRRARRSRGIDAVFRGRSFRAEATLAGFYANSGREVHAGADDPPRRPSFLVKAPAGTLSGGSGIVWLYPPEAFGLLHPDARAPLPLDRSSFVRLDVDGDVRGVYVMESADRVGSAWLALGRHAPEFPNRAFFRSMPTSPPGENGISAEEAVRRYREVSGFLCADPAFPWSCAEAAWRARRHAARREAAAFPEPRLSALDFKGANLSPMYVVRDLDLSPAGPGVRWRSSRPDVVSGDGRLLSRPDAPEGTPVELLAVFPDTRKRVFRFRVMPPSPILPALFLHVSQPVEKYWRTDFTAERVDAGPSGEVENLSGTGVSGGGLHHRGNTSYVNGAKRSLSLEFDRPVGWSGSPVPSSHVMLLSGYADATRLKNALCFHVFRALCAGKGDRLCVPVSWTEVFVNGEYYGVWETCPRLRDVVRDDAASLLKVRSPHGLWTAVTAEMTDDAMNGTGRVPDPYAEFVELSRFVVESSDSGFAARWREFFDEDNLADFALLLDFTDNQDGRVTNQYIMRRASDGRFVVCPWDYDKTFITGRNPGERLTNSLLHRVRALDPGFRAKCAARWAERRAGPLSDEALLAWIDSRAAALAPAMGEEWRLLQPAGFDGDYAAVVEALRREVLLRAASLDAEFAGLR